MFCFYQMTARFLLLAMHDAPGFAMRLFFAATILTEIGNSCYLLACRLQWGPVLC
jgi:hypothetical protein